MKYNKLGKSGITVLERGMATMSLRRNPIAMPRQIRLLLT